MFSQNVFLQVSRCECPHFNADDVKLKRLHRKKRIVLSLLYYSHVKLNYTVFTYMPRRRMFRPMERKISSQHKPRRFACLGLELKDSTIWMKWLMVVAKISMLAMRLAIWASKYASRTLSSTILNSKVFIFTTGPEFIPWLTSKISSFSPSNEFTKPVRSRKIHSGERLQKYPVSVLQTNSPNLSDPEKSILESDFKNIRFQSFKRIHQTCQIQKNPFWRATSKISGFSPSHEFTKPVRSRKIHSGERFQKSAVSVCGFTSFVWTGARFVWKRMRFQECSDSCGRGFKPLWRAVSNEAVLVTWFTKELKQLRQTTTTTMSKNNWF